MSIANNYYQVYIDNTLKLAGTIVIKSEESVDLQNKWIQGLYGVDAVDLSDPRSWKYHLTLAGEYHFSDQMMTVVSMDTLETIQFTKENLKIHRATARAYAYGTKRYYELKGRYPDQELLIKSILLPTDLDRVINARDLEIINYPSELVEFNEYSLISKLQRWIDAQHNRWFNPQIPMLDNLYLAAWFAQIYVMIAPVVLMLRNSACHTNEAHSFHVRQYLVSNGIPDTYIDYLTTKQSLWLYRNLSYIKRNAGKSYIFEWITDHLLTERNIPLGSYAMRHDISAQPEAIDPTPTFRKTARNKVGVGLGIRPITLDEILLKEDPLARDNLRLKEDFRPAMQLGLENSKSAIVRTKALESSMIDYTDATPYTKEDILLSHWLWLSYKGYYNTFVGFTSPATGERIPLSAKDAYCFMWYAYCRSVGIDLTTVPLLYAKRVVRLPYPSVNELMGLVSSKRIPRSFAEEALSVMPLIDPIISVDRFYELCMEIHAGANHHRNMVAYQEHHQARGMAQGLVSGIFSDNMCQIEAPDQLYSTWFAARNIDIKTFTREQFELTYLEILRETTGLSLHTTKSIRDVQRAMVGLMTHMSSYSVQFIREINASRISMGDIPAIRVGDHNGAIKDHAQIPDLNVRVQQTRNKFKHREHFNIWLGSDLRAKTRFATDRIRFKLPNLIHFRKTGPVFRQRLDLGNVTPHLFVKLPSNTEGIIPVPGIERYLALNQTEREGLHDIWGNNWEQPGSGDRRLSDVWFKSTLNGLVYQPPGGIDLATAWPTTTLSGLVYQAPS